MGDNRDDSLDSRFPPSEGGIGMVPVENLIGRAPVTFWSTDGSASYWKPWTWFTALRGKPHRQRLHGRRRMSATSPLSSATGSAMSRRTSRLFELALTHSSLGRRQLRAARIPRRPRARPGHRRARSTSAIPNEPEGNLSRRYNALVDRETCAEIGRELGVPALIRLGKQAREDGASQSDNVVGDVVEALIGALFLDGGLEAAERFILKLWEPRPRRASARAPQHPKSALQELAAAKGVQAAGL